MLKTILILSGIFLALGLLRVVPSQEFQIMKYSVRDNRVSTEIFRIHECTLQTRPGCFLDCTRLADTWSNSGTGEIFFCSIGNK